MFRIPTSRWLRPAGAGMLAVALVACDSPTSDPVDRDIDALRVATEPFQSFAAAQAANYTLLFADVCMEHPSDGAMGYHYVNTDLLDGEVAVDEPEALLYESGLNGELELVAVEYVIPFAVRAESEPPPVLFGQQFRQNHTYGLWALHAWVWKDNPAGMFADWNADVTCP